MCITALPDHLNTKEKIEANFPDDSQYGNTWFGLAYKRFRKWLKPHLVFGPRDIHWIHRFRELPITLFAFFGPGESRWENDFMAVRSINKSVFFFRPTAFYLSRVQYWCDWHVQLQWPLYIGGHFARYQFYVGFKRDADKVFYLSLYVGKMWK